METKLNSTGSEARLRAFGNCVRLASLLAFGTIGWQHLVHSWGSGPAASHGGHLAHALRDGALAWPLALLAVFAGLRLSRALGVGERGVRGVLERAVIIGAGFAFLLIPGVVGHALVDAGSGGGFAAVMLMAESIASNLGRFLDYGVHQALVALLAALPFAFLGLVPADPPTSSSAHRRSIRRLAPVAAVVGLLGSGEVGGAVA